MLTSREIRQQFIDFFVHNQGHTFVQSSPVVPHNDPTLLFTNAGMNQFKPYFLGTEQSPWKRVANTQKCIRAGGKHNDLDDVGRSRRHHTFFEMLGNWSFGDYFKLGAIQMAWELLTIIYKLDPTRLHVSCFDGDEANGVPRDTEAADIWRKVAKWEQYGLKSDDHIHYFGKDNFWEMGDTGPCGPCTEIYIDRRPQDEIDADLKAGKRSPVNAEDPRVMEIWNLVFIQFNRNADRSLTTLPSQHVDTGMGFERITQVIQNVDSNFGIDLWNPFFAKISEISGHKYTGAFPPTNSVDPIAEAANPQLRTDIAFRVIADHARCLTFALTDGAVPSNEGRGYVLRRILRRAVTFGYLKLGIKEPFMHKLVDVVVEAMGEAFPELKKNPAGVAAILKDEEVSFGRTIERGLIHFDHAAMRATAYSIPDLQSSGGGLVTLDKDGEIVQIKGSIKVTRRPDNETGETIEVTPDANDQQRLIAHFNLKPVISADDAFKLYTTFGFPLDLTQVMAQERGMTVDTEGVKVLMEEHANVSRGGDASADATQSLLELVQQSKLPAAEFHGYTQTKMDAVTCVHLFKLEPQGTGTSSPRAYVPVDLARKGDQVALVLDRTCFYAESGGQVGDRGTIENHYHAIVTVENTIRIGDVFFHLGTVTTAAPGGEGFVCASADSKPHRLQVDEARRARIQANHTMTHTMNHKLRAILGDHVQQKGSLVDDEKTRFDFAHNAALSEAEVAKIEELVNADIVADLPVNWEYAPQTDAIKINSLRAVFGEKYPPTVRVVSIGPRVESLLAEPDKAEWSDYSIEFCGGTHLATTGDAEGFCMVSEEAVAKGVRRITAITGQAAHKATAHGERLLARVSTLRSASAEQLAELPALTTAVAEVTAAMNEHVIPLLLRSKIREGLSELQKMLKEADKARSKAAAGDAVEAARQIADNVDGDVIVAAMPGLDGDGLRTAMDVIRKKKPNAALLLGSVTPEGDKVSFVAAVPEAMIKKGLKAGDWVREVAKSAGGGGGGRPDMAQAGGKDPAKLEEALEVGRKFAASKK